MAGADAVILHRPTPVVVPFVVHGPDAVNVTDKPEEDVALKENVLPYCTSARRAQLIVCDCRLEPWGRIVNPPDTGSAALKAFVPGCDAAMVQVPVLLRTTVAEETPVDVLIDWLPMLQDPVALKVTCNPFGFPPLSAVAVTIGCGPEIVTELGKGPRTIV